MAQDGRPFKVSCVSFIEIFLLINLILELTIYFDNICHFGQFLLYAKAYLE